MSSPLFAQARLGLRGLQFVCSLVALATIAAGFKSVDYVYNSFTGSSMSASLGSSATTFGILMTYTSMLYALFYVLAIELYHYAPRPSLMIDRYVDAFFAIVLFIAGIVVATSDVSHHCDLFGGNLRCGNFTAGIVFTFLAAAAFLATFGINFLGASATAANSEMVVRVDHVEEVGAYHIEATPTGALSPIGDSNSPAAKV